MKLDFTTKNLVPFLFCLFAFGKVGAQAPVVINELMASNTSTITDEAGEFNDWIELYNTSGSAVSLNGWFLTDNPANLTKWDFPTNTSIPAYDYLIIWADEDSSQGPLHANFKLSALGEQLMLINASGAIVQDITFGAQQTDKGYARSPNGTGSFVIKNPTFKANNDTGISAVGDVEQEGAMHIFPNPVSGGEVVLRNKNSEKQAVAIFDQLGRKRFSAEFFNETNLDVSDWPAGLYFVKQLGTIQLLTIQR
ncbi:MAG: lamin tail domain-containing protein [Saprospiraceae bacterium]|nr:lamin tail domain-containing protein [Saprospiraceae bacterium]MCF8249523.1 lamin tail domain-containing protein [Saprospiraceae bacterium]MCF8280148.1 lamin tail domain-containing protein [Bacteroidales bacterium]MCF8310741.1 lamin tail domain-containing protein [Saprospiraceae bacterium]MCF8439428.1 lamin tail domain-containing protein [Saprospiraceae bacterium]